MAESAEGALESQLATGAFDWPDNTCTIIRTLAIGWREQANYLPLPVTPHQPVTGWQQSVLHPVAHLEAAWAELSAMQEGPGP